MSFKVKSPKAAPAPPVPAPEVAPVVTPQSSRQRRLSSGGRQSTFLGGLGGSMASASPALPAPRATLTGGWGG